MAEIQQLVRLTLKRVWKKYPETISARVRFLLGDCIKYLIFVVLIQLLPAVSWGQRMDVDSVRALPRLDSLEKRANQYSETHPIEKIYVHLDKPFYVVGEVSWYKAYVITGPDLHPTDVSTVLYMDWIDPSGKVIKHQRLKIENGSAIGDFTIDKTFRQGTYTAKAYTNWMRNEDPVLFYSRSIEIFNPTSTPSSLQGDTSPSGIDLQFFPEGGTLVAGIKTQLAFKAIDSHGKGIEVKGRIVDEQNKLVTVLKSSHNGMAVIPFIAQGYTSYRAVLDGGEVYALPVPTESGLMLAASNMNANKLLVRIQASKDYVPSAVYLVGQSQGSICYAAYIELDGMAKDISISKEELPEGVLQLTLFNQEGVPQCERMVFIRKDNKMSVTIQSNKVKYAPRDSVILDLKVNDAKGNPAQTSLSVSITDAGLVMPDRNAENIYTRLLLQSDLKGNVEFPGWYFDSQTSERTYALDLVMLTHGWSRYNWKKLLSHTADSIQFMPEKGIVLEGKIIANKKPVANAPFTFVIRQRENDFVNIYESDSLGNFTIPDLDFPDTTMLSWRVMSGRKGKVQNAEIQLDTTGNIPPANKLGAQYQTTAGHKNELIQKLQTRFIKRGVWNLDSAIVLDEVVVTGERSKIKVIGAGAIAVKPGPNDLKLGTSQFINHYALGLPGAKLVRISADKEIWTTPAGGQIVISINGYIGEDLGGFASNPYIVLSAISIEQIENVVIAGDPHNGYFIDITTKDVPSQPRVESIKKKARGLGYDIVHEFYQPRYGSLDSPTTGPDNRMTLYWNANLQTNKDGKASLKFFNTDSTQKFLVDVEGIANGLTISTMKILGKE